ncbi:type III pantothenate kinase [Flavobacterium sp.]|uniref:type III pantothenate kinase n=1 Tax=Flavobacterium sp. TaxID=239 RepID=UPI00375059F6
MILTIDVGNTRIKYAVFQDNTIVEMQIIPKQNFKNYLEEILKKYQNIKHLVVASVGKIEENAFEAFSNHLKVQFISKESKFPFQNKYATPNTLGIDRMVLSAGAVLQFQNQNRLVIDAGTCVTYDFIDKNDIYHGGAISPGISLRYKSMHDYTAKLPLLSIEEPEKLIGNSTHQSIHSGVINGLSFEIDGYIDALKSKNENFIIILTGGDANFLAKRLKNTIFANSNFLLESLNNLYQYQK